MWRLYADLLAVSLLVACLPSSAPAEPSVPHELGPAPVVSIATAEPAPVAAPPAPPAPPRFEPPPPEARRDESPPLVDAGSIHGFPDYRVAPWWTPPPAPPPRPTVSIASAMPRFRRALRHCYQRSLKADPDLRGQIAVHFTVGRDGWVTVVETKQKRSLDRMAGCVRGILRRMDFPPQDPPADISFPITFVSASSRHP